MALIWGLRLFESWTRQIIVLTTNIIIFRIKLTELITVFWFRLHRDRGAYSGAAVCKFYCPKLCTYSSKYGILYNFIHLTYSLFYTGVDKLNRLFIHMCFLCDKLLRIALMRRQEKLVAFRSYLAQFTAQFIDLLFSFTNSTFLSLSC